MSEIKNKKALITGGASGIGKLMGLELLKKGLDSLMIWDINASSLQSTVDEFSSLGYKVFPFQVNVLNTHEVIETATKMLSEHGFIDILINNAGIIVGKDFIHHTHDEIDRTMGINTTALMHITHEFLPSMVKNNTGHIVNIASAAGLVSNPKMSVYVGSKFAVVGWSDSLRLELENAGTQIKVTTVTPFYINTGMFEGVKSSVLPILDPLYATQKIINGIEKNKMFVRMPGLIYWVPFLKGILPVRLFDIIAGKWFGMHHSMDDFIGRK